MAFDRPLCQTSLDQETLFRIYYNLLKPSALILAPLLPVVAFAAISPGRRTSSQIPPEIARVIARESGPRS